MSAVRTVVFTGQSPKIFDREVPRATWVKMASRVGFEVKGSVSSKVNLVVSSYEAAKEGTTKWLAAIDRDIQIISYEDFFAVLNKMY